MVIYLSLWLHMEVKLFSYDLSSCSLLVLLLHYNCV